MNNITNKKFNSNKFLNKIKKTSKEKYLANKNNLNTTNNNINLNLSKINSEKTKNLDLENNYNLNSMRTAHLKNYDIFHPKINTTTDQGRNRLNKC